MDTCGESQKWQIEKSTSTMMHQWSSAYCVCGKKIVQGERYIRLACISEKSRMRCEECLLRAHDLEVGPEGLTLMNYGGMKRPEKEGHCNV